MKIDKNHKEVPKEVPYEVLNEVSNEILMKFIKKFLIQWLCWHLNPYKIQCNFHAALITMNFNDIMKSKSHEILMKSLARGHGFLKSCSLWNWFRSCLGLSWDQIIIMDSVLSVTLVWCIACHNCHHLTKDFLLIKT